MGIVVARKPRKLSHVNMQCYRTAASAFEKLAIWSIMLCFQLVTFSHIPRYRSIKRRKRDLMVHQRRKYYAGGMLHKTEQNDPTRFKTSHHFYCNFHERQPIIPIIQKGTLQRSNIYQTHPPSEKHFINGYVTFMMPLCCTITFTLEL